MKTQFEFIHFVGLPNWGHPPDSWRCETNIGGVTLGVVGPGDYELLEFSASSTSVAFGASCLRDIAAFIAELTAARAAEKGAKT